MMSGMAGSAIYDMLWDTAVRVQLWWLAWVLSLYDMVAEACGQRSVMLAEVQSPL